jgi:hypothetical protein
MLKKNYNKSKIKKLKQQHKLKRNQKLLIKFVKNWKNSYKRKKRKRLKNRNKNKKKLQKHLMNKMYVYNNF